jgi:platelet-activating factor acetylhydrolase IB subunit alpha
MAGLKKPPLGTYSTEFVATRARDKTIKLWDTQVAPINTLLGHNNWARGLGFHPMCEYLPREFLEQAEAIRS